MAVAGHQKTGAPDTQAAIEASEQYLIDFGRLKATAGSDEELFDEMTKPYPDWVGYQAWLMFGMNTTSAARQ